MEAKNIAIQILASNTYFQLGLRFVHRFKHFYNGPHNIFFHFFSDQSPCNYLPESINCIYHEVKHDNWIEAVESKFNNILSLEDEIFDYVYFFDSDTNISRHFDDWFVGDLVGGEHFGNNTWMKDNKAYDRYEKSSCYIPLDTPLPQMYYLGAFWGGLKQNVLEMCNTIIGWQRYNKSIGHEPGVNDESYLNKYYHHNPPPKVVLIGDFPFVISDKGSIQNTRNTKLDLAYMNADILKYKDGLWDIRDSKVVKDKR